MQDFKEWVMIKCGIAENSLYRTEEIKRLDKKFYDLLNKIDDEIAEELETTVSELQELLMQGTFLAGVAEGRKVVTLLNKSIDEMIDTYMES